MNNYQGYIQATKSKADHIPEYLVSRPQVVRIIYSARALCEIRIILQKDILQNSRIFWLVEVGVARKKEEGKEVKSVRWNILPLFLVS